MTQIEFSEKYIAGNEGDVEDPEVQKIWIKYGFVNILIDSLDLFTDKEVVNQILASNLWNNVEERYILKKGKIKNMEALEGKELVEHLFEVSIDFLDENETDIYRLKGLCNKDKMNLYKEQNLYAIIQEENHELRFCCFLKKE